MKTIKLDQNIGIIMCREFCTAPAEQCRMCRLYQFVKANIHVQKQGMSIKEAIEKTEKEANQALRGINRKYDSKIGVEIGVMEGIVK